MALTMVVVPILSGSSVIANYRIGFKYWALFIAVVFVVSELVFVLQVPEKKPEEMESIGVGQMFSALIRNDQAMTVVGALILVYIAINIVGNLILYFFQFDVGNTDAYNIFVAVCFLIQVIAMMTIPAIRKKVGKISLFLRSILLQVAGFLVLLVFSYTNLYRSFSWLILIIPGILVYAGYGMLNVMLTIFLSDAVDYGEVKNGRREESVIFSMQTFTVKLASGIAVFIAGLVIRVVALDPKAASQTIATLNGLRVFMTIPSTIILIAALLVFRKFYQLDDERMEEISKELGR